MKWKCVVLLVLFLGSLAYAELPKNDVSVDARAIIPRKNEIYNNSFGTEAMFRHWFNDELGIGLSLGYEAWRFDDSKTYINPVSMQVEGRTDVIPIGIHGVWRFESGKPFQAVNFITGKKSTAAYKKARWTVSAGVCYLFMEDGAEVVAKGPGGQMKLPLETDETWVVRVQIAYEDTLPVLNVPVIIGAGYQRDISRGAINVIGSGLSTTNDMTGGFLRVGFPIIF